MRALRRPDLPTRRATAAEQRGRFDRASSAPDLPLRYLIVQRSFLPPLIVALALLVIAVWDLRRAQDARLEQRRPTACTIAGRALEADGSPAIGVAIQLEPASDTGDLYLGYSRGWLVAISDRNGAFTFGPIDGNDWSDWWIGPARDGAPLTEVNSRSPATYARPLHITEFDERIDVEVHVVRGLAIRGRITAPEDGPGLSRGWDAAIEVSALDGTSLARLRTEWSEDEFALGPLIDGEYRVVARLCPFAPSVPRLIRPNSEGTDFELRPPSSVAGVVFDARTRERVPAVLRVLTLDERLVAVEGSEPDGSFAVRALPPGRHVLAATTADGRCGGSGPFSLGTREQREGLEVAVSPGAKLRLQNLDPLRGRSFSVVRDDIEFCGEEIDFDQQVEFTVPVGKSSVRVVAPMGSLVSSIDVTLGPGETRALTFDGAWK